MKQCGGREVLMGDVPPKPAALILLGTLEIGGSETKFVSLARRLHGLGHDVHVAYLRRPFTLLPRLAGVPSVHLEQSGKWSLHAYLRLRRYLYENDIATVVTVNPYPLTYAGIGGLRNRSSRVRVVASINTSEILSRRDERFMRLYAALLRRVDHIVFGSHRQQEMWRVRYKLAGTKTSVIYNGVDAEFFSRQSIDESVEEIRARLGVPAEAPVLVCVGQLRPEKAHTDLVEAIGRLRRSGAWEPHLVLVGDGTEREAISRKIVDEQIEDLVHLVGAAEDVRPYLKAADLFVLTSIAVETFSNAALEAASVGLPIVMSDVGGGPEMFPDSVDCTIYERGDVSALAQAIQHQLERIAGKSEPVDGLRRKVVARYSTDSMDRQWSEALWQA